MIWKMDCFADAREAFKGYERFFKSDYLSDVKLRVSDKKFPAHKLVLARGSDVFERMLAHEWNGKEEELTLNEDPVCIDHFETFLRFFYFNHAVLDDSNVLPLLILADKYNFDGLRQVCTNYAISYVLKEAPLKEVVNVWFNLACKSNHAVLIKECERIIAQNLTQILSEEDWQEDWINLDRVQLLVLLKSNDLVIPNEDILFEAVQRWIYAEDHPQRKDKELGKILESLIPWIRFPFMSSQQLLEVESSELYQKHSSLIAPYILAAFKNNAIPLNAEVRPPFTSAQFLLRNYTDTRWDKRIIITNEKIYVRGVEHVFNFATKSSTVPVQTWNWTLKFILTLPIGNNKDEELRLVLLANDIDTPRSIEYNVAVVSDVEVLKQVSGRKNFTKTRTSADLSLDSEINVVELLSENSPLLVDDCLHLQISVRPVV
uniref:BTB domain-containing protein n=1 Tax=Panagrellus redivivus TaxID=6233 RepID=A0A7E4VER3_PANRE